MPVAYFFMFSVLIFDLEGGDDMFPPKPWLLYELYGFTMGHAVA
jgi:hypothetical protein